MSGSWGQPNQAGNLFVILLPTLECDLACQYCFERHPPGRWHTDQTRRVLEEVFALAVAKGISHVMLHWQGGEPLLMGRHYWEAVLPLAHELADKAGVQLRQSLQTNLIRYRSDIAPLVKTYLEGSLGTSFDLTGSRRCPEGGHERFHFLWIEGYRRALADGLQVGVLCLLDDEGVSMGFERYAEILRERYNIYKVRFTLPFASNTGAERGFWSDPEAAGRFLADGFRLWHAKGGNQWMEIRPFAHLAARFAGEANAESGLCLFCPNCADLALSIGPGNQVSLCDNFAYPSSAGHYGHLVNSTLTTIFDGALRAATKNVIAMLSTSEKCSLCRYLPHCHGGCLARYSPVQPGQVPEYHYCETYRILFQEVEKVLLQ